MSFALYIHWPFCLSKCPYCDFNSHVRERFDEHDWERAYLKVLDQHAGLYPKGSLKSVFFGGGTPSLMSPKLVEKVLAKVNDLWGSPKEITLEANPNSVEVSKFEAFKSAGVNRISVGIQSFNDEDLKFLGRQHSAKEGLAALEIASRVFDNFTFDLIYARPNQTLEMWNQELNQALEWRSPHLSLYQLTIEPGTAFEKLYNRGDFKLPDEDLAADLYELTREQTALKGLLDYEVSNYAKPGFESLHNLAYWEYQDYVGIGPGAHGRITERAQKFATKQYKTPEKWLKKALEGDSYEEKTELSLESQNLERLLMGLRLKKGITWPYSKKIETLVFENLAFYKEGVLSLSPEGRLKTNSVLEYLVKGEKL